jgi:hypothetical protein
MAAQHSVRMSSSKPRMTVPSPLGDAIAHALSPSASNLTSLASRLASLPLFGGGRRAEFLHPPFHQLA